MALVLGVDPGLTGGLAFTIDKNNSTLYPMPIDDSELDVDMFMSMLIVHNPKMAIVEKPQMRMMNQGLLTSAANYGMMLGLLKLRQIPIEKIGAITWGNVIIPDVKGKDKRKKAAIDLAQKNGITIPTIRPKGKKLSDGCADAYCISLYGLWKLTNK